MEAYKIIHVNLLAWIHLMRCPLITKKSLHSRMCFNCENLLQLVDFSYNISLLLDIQSVLTGAKTRTSPTVFWSYING